MSAPSGAGSAGGASGSVGGAAPTLPALSPAIPPIHLLPPIVSAYLPSQPPPSIVDLSRQRPDQISLLQIPASKLQSGDSTTTTLQVRKRVRPTDAVRQNVQKKFHSSNVTLPTGASGLHVKELPERLDINIPESGLINQLIGLEKRLDATIARKHVEIQHALLPQLPQQAQVIRLFIWHEFTTPLTHEELMNGMTQSDKPEMPAWLLKIQGQILDAPSSEGGTVTTQPLPTRCLANYLSSMVIQIETKQPPPSSSSSSSSTTPPPPSASTIETIEWRKHSAVALSDGFEIRRRGASEVQCQIALYLDYSPQRYRLSPGLTHALGLPLYAPNPLYQHGMQPNPAHPFPYVETQSNVLAAFWEYVRQKKLQEEKNPTIIKCDAVLTNVSLNVVHTSRSTATMRYCSMGLIFLFIFLTSLFCLLFFSLQLFGVSEIPVSSVLSLLQLHLVPASSEAILIPYTLRPNSTLSGPPPFGQSTPSLSPTGSPSAVTCYDILTYTPVIPNLQEAYKEASTRSGLKTVPPPNFAPVVARLTDKTYELMLDVDRCNRRREFLQAFSEAPVQVLQMLIAQQAKDQLIMMGVTGVDDELERRGEFYHADWQYDAVDRMMAEEASQATSAMSASANMFDETPQDE